MLTLKPKTAKKLLVATTGVATLTFANCLCLPVANLPAMQCDGGGTACYQPPDSGNQDGGPTDGGAHD